MKAMLERLIKESEEKRIKLHEEEIAGLTIKLEKRPTQSLRKKLSK